MDPSTGTFKTTNTNRWGILSSPEDQQNPTPMIPPRTQAKRTPIAFGSELVPPKDPAAYSREDPVMLKLHAQGLQVPLPYGSSKQPEPQPAKAVATTAAKPPPTSTLDPRQETRDEPPLKVHSDSSLKVKPDNNNNGANQKETATAAVPSATASSSSLALDPTKDCFATHKWKVLSTDIAAESQPVPEISTSSQRSDRVEGTVLPLSTAMDWTTEPAAGALQPRSYPSHDMLVQAEISGRNIKNGDDEEAEVAAAEARDKAEKHPSTMTARSSKTKDTAAGSPAKKAKENDAVIKTATERPTTTIMESAPTKSKAVTPAPIEDKVLIDKTISPATPVETTARCFDKETTELSYKENETKSHIATMEPIPSQGIGGANSGRAVAREDRAIEKKADMARSVSIAPSLTRPGTGDIAVNQENTPPTATVSSKRLLVLIARQSFNRTAVQDQEKAMTILELRGIEYDIIDGADPANKEERNALFTLSGMRGKYPQFFLVQEDGSKVFWGDMERFLEVNDNGNLELEFRGEEKVPDKQSTPTEGKAPAAEEPGTTSVKGEGDTTNRTTEAPVLVLISRQSFDREVLQNQQNALTILDSKGIKYSTIDGADPANKVERNALFALSGLRAKYPQFFLVRDGQKTFYGNMDTFSEANDVGTLAQDLGVKTAGSVDTLPTGPAPVANGQEAGEITETAPFKGEEKENISGNKSKSLDMVEAIAGTIKKSPVTDITIYGATSFVAKHVIKYLVQTSIHLPDPLQITLAGRNKQKVESLKHEWEKKMALLLTALANEDCGRCDFDVFIADSADTDGIRRMAARTEVILSCAGPFAQYGGPVVAACAEFGTDYVDITGEIGWVGEMREKHGSTAAASGARIVSLCGCDSVPSDLAIFAAVQALKKESSEQMEIENGCTWYAIQGSAKVNGGSLKTIQEYPLKLSHCFGRSVPFLLDDPLILAHPKVRSDTKSDALRNRLALAEWLNQFLMFHAFLKGGVSSPFLMAAVNAKVVHASALSLNYGTNFSYQERFLPLGIRGTAQLQVLSFIPAFLTHIAILLGLLALKMPLVGSLIVDFLGGPGMGASDGMCAGGHVEVYSEVRSPAKKDGKVDKANIMLKFKGDPGNWVTAQCVSEAALVLLLEREDLPVRSEDGFGTPSELLGNTLLRRLRESPVRRVEYATHVRKGVSPSERQMFL